MTDEKLTIRGGRADDADMVMGFLRDLAALDGEADICRMTAADVRRWGFGPDRRFEILVAELADGPAGMILFYSTFSTWDAKPGILVNDLYVTDWARGRGIGRRHLAEVAALAVERQWGRVEWHVLHQADAVTFYDAMGGRKADEFQTYRLTGDALLRLAEHARSSQAAGQGEGER
ncbi:MAG: GNAT family N-acetyltransferase [Dongiaceae bacterium]